MLEPSGGPPPAVLRASSVPEGESIDLDGALTEVAWAAAAPIVDFTQQEPVEGGSPTEETEIRVLIDGSALYIGAKFFDDPEGILAHQRRRDQGLGTDDRFMWILDTFLDGRTGYFF
ncbi:MAG: hydrolase, partial [Gemmatimonadetes bacterium]|nr:hydrolase [Gemmatimonadota bacterium]